MAIAMALLVIAWISILFSSAKCVLMLPWCFDESDAAKLRDYLSQYWFGMRNLSAEIATLLTTSTDTRTRIIVHGYAGCGKTLLLRKIHSYFEDSNKSVSYIDIATLTTNKYSTSLIVSRFMSVGVASSVFYGIALSLPLY